MMMELAGKGPYSMLSGGSEPDAPALVEAFSTLFGRGLIERKDDRFALSAAGYPFARMRDARCATAVRAAWGYDAMAYPSGEALWIAELSRDPLSQWYRVRRTGRDTLEAWLFDARVLQPPLLTDGDAAEVKKLFAEELRRPSGNMLASFQTYRSGGQLLRAYELRMVQGGQLILYGGPEEERKAEIYTVEALARMLAECFGKDSHDHRECERSRY